MKTNNYCANHKYDYDYDNLYIQVRKRPRMFTGATGFYGVRNCILYLVEYALDNNKKEITINVDNINKDITLSYDGSELPRNIDIDIVRAISENFSHENNVLKFWPDNSMELFNKLNINNDVLFDKIRELAFLNKDVVFTFNGHKFHYKNGLVDLYKYFENSSVYFNKEYQPFEINYYDENIEVNIVFSFTENNGDIEKRILSYINNNRTVEHGSHVDGFIDGLKSELLYYRKSCCENIEDFRFLSVALVIHVKKLKYGATKWKIEDDEIYKAVNELSKEKLRNYFKENIEVAEANTECGCCRHNKNV